MDDLISRAAAINAICEDGTRLERNGHYSMTMVERKQRDVDILENLPSAQPERKKGEWVKAKGSWCTPGGDPVWECSECGKGVHVYGIEHGSYGSDIADGQWVSCPNCDADMRGEDDE